MKKECFDLASVLCTLVLGTKNIQRVNLLFSATVH